MHPISSSSSSYSGYPTYSAAASASAVADLAATVSTVAASTGALSTAVGSFSVPSHPFAGAPTAVDPPFFVLDDAAQVGMDQQAAAQAEAAEMAHMIGHLAIIQNMSQGQMHVAVPLTQNPVLPSGSVQIAAPHVSNINPFWLQ